MSDVKSRVTPYTDEENAIIAGSMVMEFIKRIVGSESKAIDFAARPEVAKLVQSWINRRLSDGEFTLACQQLMQSD